ncbi:MAG: RNA methyltransferase [Gallionella sp.]|jgi:23S rRNA (adenine2503-C2)-methyltransferase
MRISHLRQRLRDLGAKPCHEDRLLRGWSQLGSYDRKGSLADDFFPKALRNELPAIEAELNGLAKLHGEYPANAHVLNINKHPGSHDRSPTPALMEPLAIRLSPQAGKSLVIPRIAGEGANVALRASSNDDEVARLLVELADGQMVESVLLPRGGLCVSTQVGCAVGCVFCMSGRNGLIRQLGSAEIVAQVVLARKRRTVSKVVFMGMGEPAHNLDNVLEAIELLGLQGNIGHKNLVLSTVGDLRVFERLMEGLKQPQLPIPPLTPPLKGGENSSLRTHILRGGKDSSLRTLILQGGERSGLQGGESSGLPAFPPPFQGEGRGGDGVDPADGPSRFNGTVKPALALSLHTTDAALRTRLLPHAPQIPIEELVERAESYARATSYPVQYQWTLIEGVNDSDAELERIARLLAGKYAVMNFIPFNEVDGLAYRRPSAERTAAMVQTLKRHGILAKIRDSAGQEIEGACGQLRARASKK